jgi:hypothetical protein
MTHGQDWFRSSVRAHHVQRLETCPATFRISAVGATDYNGTTRPTAPITSRRSRAARWRWAVHRATAWAISWARYPGKLDNQIGVVQNEKRQGDNRPGGLVDHEVLANPFPTATYSYDTIGSMADLDAASLRDVKQWFVDNRPQQCGAGAGHDVSAAERGCWSEYLAATPRGRQQPGPGQCRRWPQSRS